MLVDSVIPWFLVLAGSERYCWKTLFDESAAVAGSVELRRLERSYSGYFCNFV